MGVYIPNMKKERYCEECPLSGTRHIDIYEYVFCELLDEYVDEAKKHCPLIEIDLVRCGECKHKPIKHDPEGDEFGFNLVSPNGYDNLCPCLNTDDGFYSYMPEDNFFCAFGERRAYEKKKI